MKICFILGSFPYMSCGVGDYTGMLAINLAKKGYDVSVITSKKACSQYGEVKVYNIIDKFDFKSIKTIIKQLKKIKPDVINLQYPSNGFNNRRVTSLFLPIAIRLSMKKSKLVETIHEYRDYSWKGKKIYWLNYKSMDSIIVVEDYYKKNLQRDFKNKYKKLNVKHIAIGSNIPKNTLNEDEKQNIINSLNLNGYKIISYFGFARLNKGIENLLNALSKIKDEKIKLLYIGDLTEKDEYQNSLLELIKKLHLEDRVIMTGYIKDNTQVANYLSISDVCVLPFLDGVHERYGSFLAACEQNIKIITTTLEDIKDEEGIYYIKPNDSDLLSKKIEEVINLKNVKSNKKINNWDDIANKYSEVYKEILNEK